MTMTKTAAVMGSPFYMSPEQLKSSRNVDARCDVWAIGVVLFELVSGKPPFIAETIAELGALVLSGDAPRLMGVVPDVPPGLSDVVATCLQRRVEDRFVNLADFAEAVAPFGGPNAKASAQRIIDTLGMPASRATINASSPASTRPLLSRLDQTQRMPDSGTGNIGQWSASGKSAPSHPSGAGFIASTPGFGVTTSPTSSHSVTASPQKASRAIAMLGVLLVALGATGAFLIYKTRFTRAEHAAPLPPMDPAASSFAATAPPLVPTPVLEPPVSTTPVASASTPSTAVSTTPPSTAVAGTNAAHTTPPRSAISKNAAHAASTQTQAPANTTPSAKPTSTSGFATNPTD